MAKMGAPSKDTPLRRQIFLDAMRRAATKNAAAAAAGVTWSTVRGWIEGDEEFEEEVKIARHEGQNELIKVVYDAAVGAKEGSVKEWRASMEILKRLFREDGWGDSLDLSKIPSDVLMAQLAASEEIADPPEDRLQRMIDGGFVDGSDAL